MKNILVVFPIVLSLVACEKSLNVERIQLSKNHWTEHNTTGKDSNYTECIRTTRFMPKEANNNQTICRSLNKAVYEELKNNFMNDIISKEKGVTKVVNPVDQLYPVKSEVVSSDLK